MPRTGLEPARLAALAPETSASTIPPPGHFVGVSREGSIFPARLPEVSGMMAGFLGAKIRGFGEICKGFNTFL